MNQVPYVGSFDIDPAAVEQNYRQVKTGKNRKPAAAAARSDKSQPGDRLGEPRTGFVRWARSRGSGPGAGADPSPCDLEQCALSQLADFFAETGKWLVIEFVPKSDSQVKKLLASREDIFPDYTRDRV